MIDIPGPTFADLRDPTIGTLACLARLVGRRVGVIEQHIELLSHIQMLISPWKGFCRPSIASIQPHLPKTRLRPLLTLAIESSWYATAAT